MDCPHSAIASACDDSSRHCSSFASSAFSSSTRFIARSTTLAELLAVSFDLASASSMRRSRFRKRCSFYSAATISLRNGPRSRRDFGASGRSSGDVAIEIAQGTVGVGKHGRHNHGVQVA